MCQFPDHGKTKMPLPQLFHMTHIPRHPQIGIFNTVRTMYVSCVQQLQYCPYSVSHGWISFGPENTTGPLIFTITIRSFSPSLLHSKDNSFYWIYQTF